MSNPTLDKWRERLRWLASQRLFWPLAGLAGLLLFNLLFTKGFFNFEVRGGHLYGPLVDILNNGSEAILLALGMTMVIAVEGVDLSVGSIMAISGGIVAWCVTETQADVGTIIALALLASLVAGLLNGVLVGLVRIQPIVATLILMVGGRGVAKLITGGQLPFKHPDFAFIGNGHLMGIPVTVIIAVVVCLITAVVIRRTAMGTFIEAVGDNETASRFSGINAPLVKVLVYTFCGLCAGIAGIIAACDVTSADSTTVGKFSELDAIFAVIVGGTAFTGGRFTIVGSIIGAVLIQTLTTTMIIWGVPSHVAPAPKAIVIIAVCLIQSDNFRRHVRRLFSAVGLAPKSGGGAAP
ncbi:ABC transporter permease [Candidatus Sumerlaeota bacterium]